MEESIERNTLQAIEEQDCNGLATSEGDDEVTHVTVCQCTCQDTQVEEQERHLDQPLCEDVDKFNNEEQLISKLAVVLTRLNYSWVHTKVMV